MALDATVRTRVPCPYTDRRMIDEKAIDAAREVAVDLLREATMGAPIRAALQLFREELIFGPERPDVDLQSVRMRSLYRRRCRERLVDADRIGVARDIGEVADGVLQKLDQRQSRHAAQLAEVAVIEGLDEHRGVRRGKLVTLERIEYRGFLWQAQLAEMLRMLGLRIDTHRGPSRELQDLIEGRYRELPVEGGILRAQQRQAFARPQGAQFFERKVFREPAVHGLAVYDLGASARREFGMGGDVGGLPNLIFVTRNQHPVAGHDEVRFDVVRPLVDRPLIGRKGMLRPLPARAPMGDDDDFAHSGSSCSPPLQCTLWHLERNFNGSGGVYRVMQNNKPMNIIWARAALVAASLLGLGWSELAVAGGREEGRLLTATQVLEEVQGIPDQRVPDYLLERAYGIAVIPDVTKVAFIFGGRRGKGVLVVRDKLTSAWSNPVFITLTGGSWGLQAGAESSDIILVFTTKAGIEGIAGGKLSLGADASVATGPVGRQGSAATDINFNAEIYSYARTRGLFGGLALDGSVISIDSTANAALYGKSDVTATEIFSGQAPAAPADARKFLERLSKSTSTPVRASPAPLAEVPAAPAAGDSRTYPLDTPPVPATESPTQ